MSETTDTVRKLLDILDIDDRIVIASDSELGYLVTWNKKCTLQLWNLHLDEVDIRTLSEKPLNIKWACAEGHLWLDDIREGR